MKRFTYILLATFILFAACDNGSDDDLKKENEQLKEALAGNAKIEKVEFENGQMILTYSNGMKIGTEIPAILKGEDGATPHIGDDGNWWIGDKNTGVSATGKKGVGIKEITYDEKTGILTITLTNDQVSKFVINNKEGDLLAVIMEDLNGKYVVKRITMGDIPYAEIGYTTDNQIKKLTSYTADGYQIVKSFEVEKEYENKLPVKITTKHFAEEKTTKYTDERYENSYPKQVFFDEDKGYKFVEEIDGKYYCYIRSWEENGKYMYTKYIAYKDSRLNNEMISNGDGTYTVYKSAGDMYIYNEQTNQNEYYCYYRVKDECFVYDEYQGNWGKSVKLTENKFKIYYHDEANINTNGNESYKHIYSLEYIRTIEGLVEIGGLLSEKNSEIKYNSDNTIDKIYNSIANGEEATSYYQNSYDEDKLAKVEMYSKDGDNWIKDAAYLTFTYNSQNLLEETIEHDSEGNKTVIAKIEYDQEGNPIELFKYFGDITYEDYFDYHYHDKINPDTGLPYDGDEVYKKAGLYSYAKLEYNYSMKNFFGNTFAGLFPELYGFNCNNAIKSATISNSFVAGAIEYKDFNDGGYPETMKFIGNSDYELEGYVGLLKIEYKKIEE